MVRENTRGKCCQTVCVESEFERGLKRGAEKNGIEMEGSERRETSEGGRGKGGNIVEIKMSEKSENGKEKMRCNEES